MEMSFNYLELESRRKLWYTGCGDDMSSDTRSRGYLHEDYRLFHIRDQKDIHIETHFHSFDKVICFLEGDVTYTIEGKEYHLKPRDILLVRHDEVHRPVISPDRIYDRWILYLDRNYLQALSTEEEPLYSCFDLCASKSAHLLRVPPDSHRRFMLLMRQMRDAETSGQFGHRLLSRSVLTQILVELCRFSRDAGATAADEGSDPQIAQVTAYIQNHLDEDLSSDALAERFGVTPSYLLHRFQKATGYTPHAYVQLKRILSAAELIASGVPAGDACRQAGYHDYSVFSRAFIKRFGVSPSRYRPEAVHFGPVSE